MKYLLLFLLIILSINADATSYCSQEFNMIGLDTSKAVTLYISESISGECSLVKLHKIIINDSSAERKEIHYEIEESFEHTCNVINNRISKKIKNKNEIPVEFLKEDSLWKCQKSDVLIKESKFTLELQERVKKEDSVVGYIWNRKYGSKGIISPIFINTNAVLLNYHPTGFYVDYEIDKIYYFKNTGIILILTHQSRYASGMDTMHGYLLYKID